MNREEFQRLIDDRPVVIRMNDGREYYIAAGQNVMVGDFNAGFLVNVDGVKRNAIVSFTNIASITCGAAPNG